MLVYPTGSNEQGMGLKYVLIIAFLEMIPNVPVP